MTEHEREMTMQALSAAFDGGSEIGYAALARVQELAHVAASERDGMQTLCLKDGTTYTMSLDAVVMVAQGWHERTWRCVAIRDPRDGMRHLDLAIDV